MFVRLPRLACLLLTPLFAFAAESRRAIRHTQSLPSLTAA